MIGSTVYLCLKSDYWHSICSILSTFFEKEGHNVALVSDMNIVPQELHFTFWFSYIIDLL